MNQENRWKSSFQNWISVIAGIAAIVLFACLLFLIILDFIAKEHNPYVEAVAFLILPGFLVAALLLVVYGAWRERRQRVKRGYVRRFPHIDFNHPTHQKIALVAVGVVTLFLLFSMYGTYRAYEFTESVAFCGTICHQVMEPEHTAYQHSPHARVTCVQCHIGPGAGWYVRSKLSGAYQIYSVIAKKYSRPIETPVKNLRPAQETCEQCHWPQKFFGAIDQDRHYFLSDETNSPWNVRMLMFVGGGTPPYGKREGIHWHMNINNKVYYVASDEKRQTIPWVKAIHPDGKEEVFVDKESEFTADKPPAGEMRRMDCIDCHNRPSHVFKSPDATVNEAMAYGAIDRELPFIKRESVKALLGKYDSKDSARE
ncbi:MAG: NapC/NirT family cytochrome c, partial [Candidatus Omnitrophica bacterium]|nr:NapC/NirT family cytochrome c [Candidatus Omnitrophota bacterium]